MSRHRKSIPSYLLHQQSGRARAVWTDPAGIRQYRMLPGPFDSPESRAAFATLLLELEASPNHGRPASHRGGITVNEVLLAYVKHAERHYRGPYGNPTGETQHVRVVCRAVRELYGMAPAADFGPLALKAVRQRFVEAGGVGGRSTSKPSGSGGRSSGRPVRS
jgi:hypothetical protein